MNVSKTWDHIEDLGKQRASKNTEISLKGDESPDVFEHEGMSIHNPWESSCGRFEVDPYSTYGRSFIIWLLRPFYKE